MGEKEKFAQLHGIAHKIHSKNWEFCLKRFLNNLENLQKIPSKMRTM